jgi:SdpC family antimicrobial peptide
MGYDGEVLFRALFFGQGELSTVLFPEVWQNENIEAKRGPHDPEVIAFREDVVEWIASNHSAFFAEFGRELQSGDHVRVDATLNAAGGMLEKAVFAVGDGEVLAAATKKEHISPMDETCIFVYRTLAVAIHYAAVVWRVKVAAVTEIVEKTGALQREQFVDVVTRRLAWTG